MMVWHCHDQPSLKPATAIRKMKKRPATAAVTNDKWEYVITY